MKCLLTHYFTKIGIQRTENVKRETSTFPKSKSTWYADIQSIRMKHRKIIESSNGRVKEHTHILLSRYPFNETDMYAKYQQEPLILTVQTYRVLSAFWWLKEHNDTYRDINIEETNLKWMKNQELKQSCNNTIMSKCQFCIGPKVSFATNHFEQRWRLFNGVAGIIGVLLGDVLNPKVSPCVLYCFIHSCLVIILI